ncbi:MAG: PadR family transcriptional regulator [Anaerolineales bacterium]|nr:PadR family transcriptional regulator [Anaerolineales bacterium]
MTNAELAILSLVGEHPCHGYEIEQVISERGMRDWTEIGFSSIYYLLNKLEKTGLVKSMLEKKEGRGPARKVYTITAAGRFTQVEASIQALSQPGRCYPSFLLGVANFPLFPPTQIAGALRQYLTELTARRKQIFLRMEEQRPLPDHVEVMFDYSLTMVEAEIGWLMKTLKKMESCG